MENTQQAHARTLVFEYTVLGGGRYLLTLNEKENPKRYIKHPLNLTFIKEDPLIHFNKNRKLFKLVNIKKEVENGLHS